MWLGRRGCRYDNVTIKYQDGYINEESIWCGEDKPPLIRASNAVEIIFRTDNYLARSGFEFKYFLHGTRQNNIIIIRLYLCTLNKCYLFSFFLSSSSRKNAEDC